LTAFPRAPAMSVLKQIESMLSAADAAYRLVHHAPTRTSEESARVRGEPIENGAKALVLKVDDRFGIFVLSAALKVDARSIRRHLHARRSRFATADELLEITGLVPGSVPPFGRPLFDLDLYVDPSILARNRIAFNAGSLTDSVIMSASDYAQIAIFETLRFAQPA
jgi:prolyl-tRNA editing enzyme YbaK/EbsC (Cys-tRNA(Pro) deacylase)